MSTSARSSSEVEPVSAPSTSALRPPRELAALDLPCRSDLVIAAMTPSTLSGRAADVRARRSPLLAKTSTMPVAMVPVPTTPTVPDVVLELRLRVGRRRPVVGDHDRAVGRLVGVEAAAGLAAEHARGDHLLEDRRRRVQPVAALAVHRLEDLVRRVEADQVEQRQRAHRVAAAEAHRGVDVLARGVAALVHRDRVVEVAEQQRVGDEAGLVAADDRGLAEASAISVLTSSSTCGLGDHGADDLDEVLHRRRVEEVHADDPAGPGVGGRDLGDRERSRCSWRGSSSGPTIASSWRKSAFLISSDSTTASTTRSAAATVLERRCVKVIRPSSSACSASVSFSALHRAGGRVLEVLAAAVQRVVVLLDADDGEPVAGEDLGDAGTHGAQADHADRREGAGLCGRGGRCRHAAHRGTRPAGWLWRSSLTSNLTIQSVPPGRSTPLAVDSRP